MGGMLMLAASITNTLFNRNKNANVMAMAS
jgi:hypothetical protein